MGFYDFDCLSFCLWFYASTFSLLLVTTTLQRFSVSLRRGDRGEGCATGGQHTCRGRAWRNKSIEHLACACRVISTDGWLGLTRLSVFLLCVAIFIISSLGLSSGPGSTCCFHIVNCAPKWFLQSSECVCS